MFEGRSQRMPHERVFGGQVLAQCVMAAGLTLKAVEERDGPRPIHSLHGYFMRPGDDTQPIRFAVEEMRDGRSFSTRRVHAIQNDAPIMSFTGSFQAHAPGLEHQLTMPELPGPEGLRSLADLLGRIDHPAAHHIAHQRPIEQRPVDEATFLSPSPGASAEQQVWMRALGALPDDPLIHAAVLAYASDYSLLDPVLRRHGLLWGDSRLRVASLDHSMWFHRPVAADRWFLYVAGVSVRLQRPWARRSVRCSRTASSSRRRRRRAWSASRGPESMSTIGQRVRMTATSWPSSQTPDSSTTGARPHDTRTRSTMSPVTGTTCDLGRKLQTTWTWPRCMMSQPAVLIDVHRGRAQVP